MQHRRSAGVCEGGKEPYLTQLPWHRGRCYDCADHGAVRAHQYIVSFRPSIATNSAIRLARVSGFFAV